MGYPALRGPFHLPPHLIPILNHSYTSFKQATSFLRLQAADAVSIAYVEAKPGGFVFDVAGSRLMKKLSDSHGAYCAGSLLIVYE